MTHNRGIGEKKYKNGMTVGEFGTSHPPLLFTS
jgi:hypothetical protein